MKQRPRVLFVSHEGTRTGAPIALLTFLRWLRDNSDVRIHILTWLPAPLEADFQSYGPTRVVHRRGPRPKRSRLAAWMNGASLRAWLAIRPPFDLVYLNSAESADYHRYALRRAPTLMHIHEMGTALDLFTDAVVKANIPRAQRFVAASAAVRDSLIDQIGIEADRIMVRTPFIDIERAGLEVARADGAARRTELGVEPDAFVVVGSGSTGWRKGTDLFLQLAATVTRQRADLNAHFVWVGGDPRAEYERLLGYDVRRAGLEERIHFIGNTNARLDYFAMGDVFALTSREDPFPLACLEASLLGLPIVSFDNGGMREFLSDDAGFLIPYLDVDAMADQVIALLKDADLRHAASRRAAEKVRRDHDVSTAAPEIYAEMQALL